MSVYQDVLRIWQNTLGLNEWGVCDMWYVDCGKIYNFRSLCWTYRYGSHRSWWTRHGLVRHSFALIEEFMLEKEAGCGGGDRFPRWGDWLAVTPTVTYEIIEHDISCRVGWQHEFSTSERWPKSLEAMGSGPTWLSKSISMMIILITMKGSINRLGGVSIHWHCSSHLD